MAKVVKFWVDEIFVAGASFAIFSVISLLTSNKHLSMASNNREPAIRFNDLYNALALFAMDYENLMKLDGPGFDVEFELESEYVIGFDIRNLDYLVDNKIITAYVKDELLEFQSFIESIPGEFWFVSEFETNPVWNDVRRRADEMLNLLGISYRDYDSSYITIIDA